MRATLWLTLFYVPLLPLGTWRVIYAGEALAFVDGVDDVLLFRKIERLPLDFGGAITTLCIGWGVFLVGVLPLVLIFVRVMNRAATMVEFILLMTSVLWLCGVAFTHMHWQKRSAERARDAWVDKPAAN